MSRKEAGFVPVEQRILKHREKNALIVALEADSGSEIGRLFLDLGQLLLESSDLSKTQRNRLASLLQVKRILHYCTDNVESLYDDTVDDGWWDIEHNGEAQALALGVTSELTKVDMNQAEVIASLSSLFNAGHKVGFERHTESYVINPQFSLQKYEEVERSVYKARFSASRILRKLGVIDPAEEETAVEAAVGEFSKLPTLECFIVMQIIDEIRSLRNSPTELFRKLQGVLYLGYGLAMREAPIFEDRYYNSTW